MIVVHIVFSDWMGILSGLGGKWMMDAGHRDAFGGMICMRLNDHFSNCHLYPSL